MDLVLRLLGVILLLCNPATAALSDTVVLAGDSTNLSCPGSSPSTNWRHRLNTTGGYIDVYVDKKIKQEYSKMGFSIDSNNRSLLIGNVTAQSAGKYECKKFGPGISTTTELIELLVIDSLPDCRVYVGEIIGPNDCNVPTEEIQLSCSVVYRNKAPGLEWRKHGEKIEVLQTNCTPEIGSLERCNATVKPDRTNMNGSYFVCQTKDRAAEEQYNCTANVSVDLLYAFGSEESSRTKMFRGDKVECVANSSQSCSYKWVWYEKIGDDISRTIESIDHVLIARKIGLHRCEAQCDLKNQKCLVFPKFVDVIPSENSPQQSAIHQPPEEENQLWNASIFGLIIPGVVIHLACGIWGCYLFKQMQRQESRRETQNRTRDTHDSAKALTADSRDQINGEQVE